MNVVRLSLAKNSCGQMAAKNRPPTRLDDFERLLANRIKHDSLAKLTYDHLPSPAHPDREPCVRALVVTLRFLPSLSLKEEHLEVLRGAIGPRNQLIIDEVKAAVNRPSDSDPKLRYALRCVLSERDARGGIARLGVIALLHRLHRLAPCLLETG